MRREAFVLWQELPGLSSLLLDERLWAQVISCYTSLR